MIFQFASVLLSAALALKGISALPAAETTDTTATRWCCPRGALDATEPIFDIYLVCYIPPYFTTSCLYNETTGAIYEAPPPAFPDEQACPLQATDCSK